MTGGTLAHSSQRPGEILDAIDQPMLAGSSDPITTCLLLPSR
ncbi:MAG TPA: hypothetical protein VI320_03020 [Terracidiphilus sp.]